MAEIALVASIFGLASFRTKVATSLYEAADILIHAHQQIASMTKHVSQFTTILRHLGRFLEAGKGSCSGDLLREIPKIKRSCKTTFKEIHATIQSKLYRPFIPVRWLFRSSKARELEARLDSEQSMLQVMIHTITVSKLGDMHLKSKEDSKQITGLREEINVLKTLIIENHTNSVELQRAEQRTEAEARRQPLPEATLRQRPQGSKVHGHKYPFQNSLSSLSGSGHGDLDPGILADDAMYTMLQDQRKLEEAQLSDNSARTDEKTTRSAVQPSVAYNGTMSVGTHRASTVLLQMVPYRPAASKAFFDRPNLLIGTRADGIARPEDKLQPIMKEVTKSVRLLLDKWTTSGSAPVSDMLMGSTSKDSLNGNVRRKPTSDLSSPSQQVSCTDDWSDNEVDGGDHLPPKAGNSRMFNAYDPSDSRRPMPSAPAWVPAFETSHVRTVDVWKSTDAFGSTPSRYLGHSILKALGHTSGGIVYMKRSNLQHAVFVDDLEIYRFNLVPSSLITPEESLILSTEIGKGWVCQEALDLLGYLYSDMPSGKVSIPRNLYFSEIKELVRLSYQGFSRGLEERSRQIIEERGWHEVVVSKQEIPVYPIRQPRSPDTRDEWRLPDARSPGSEVERRINYISNDYIQRRGPASKPQNGPFPTRSRSTTLENGPIKVEQKADQKLAATEIGFTMPHAPTVRRPDNRNGGREFRRAEEKLNSHSERRDETLAVSEHNIKPFLEEDIIIGMKPKVKRSKRVQKKDSNSDHAEKRHRVPHTLVETDEE